jgi:acetyl-CoA synthetase
MVATLLDEASDNNTEIMKILCLYSILPVPLENLREWCILQQDIWCTAYTLKNVFNYEDNDIFWCTADIGWITGHSYILYGPLLNGATTVIFEGVPSSRLQSFLGSYC